MNDDLAGLACRDQGAPLLADRPTREGALGLPTEKYGAVQVQIYGTESIALWLMFDDVDGEPWYQFSAAEALKIRDFLNHWFPKEGGEE